MNHALGLAVLRGSVGTRHSKLDAVRQEESTGRGVIKLTSIVALDAPDGAAKLHGHKDEVGESVEGVGLLVQQNGPRVVGAVIEDDHVILVTREQGRSRGHSVRGQRVERLEKSLERGNRTCRTSWQAWHKESSLPEGM
jgi:hypothetical protein